MTTTFVNIHEAKTHLSRLLNRVAAGDEIIIAKAGKPMARLVPYLPTGEPRQPGSAKGKIRVSDDFNEALPEEWMALFEGGEG